MIFLGTECPVARLAGPRLAELAARYRDQGVAFVGIDSNAQDSLADIAHYAKEHKITFPILKDPGNTVADQFGAEADARRVCSRRRSAGARIRGMIDNQYGVGYARPTATSNYIADALDELLAGKKVTRAATEPSGCYIGRAQRATAGGKVTYAKDVARVFNQHCVLCHRTGQVGPFALDVLRRGGRLGRNDQRDGFHRADASLARQSAVRSFFERRPAVGRGKTVDLQLGRRGLPAGKSGGHARAAEVRRGLADSAARPGAEDARAV